MVRAIKAVPDTQPVVEYIYNTCKAGPAYADTLRKKCFVQRNKSTKKTAEFNQAVYKMSGDPRDLEAINDCFRRASKGFSEDELKAIAQVFIKYRNARKQILEVGAKIKRELKE